MSEILWEPKKSNIKDSNMFSLYEKAFQKKLSSTKEFSYDLLHKWSLDNIEEFWNLVWDDANIIGTKGKSIINDYNDLIKSKFFPKGHLNFAENLLVGEDHREAIIFYGEGKEKKSLSLKELKSKVEVLAKWLIKNGVTKGDRVAVLATNSPETIISMLATAAVGAIFTSCSPDFGEEGIIDRFGQCNPKIFITTDGYIYGGKNMILVIRLIIFLIGFHPSNKQYILDILMKLVLNIIMIGMKYCQKKIMTNLNL